MLGDSFWYFHKSEENPENARVMGINGRKIGKFYGVLSRWLNSRIDLVFILFSDSSSLWLNLVCCGKFGADLFEALFF